MHESATTTLPDQGIDAALPGARKEMLNLQIAFPPVAREATIRWFGHPPGGEPRLTVGSHSLSPSPPLNIDLDIPHPLATSPGELFAGAIGVVFAKLVADQLLRETTPATELVVRIGLTLEGERDDRSDLMLRSLLCHLGARVPDIDQRHLQVVAESAMRRCMEGLAMRIESISVAIEAVLEQGSSPPSKSVESSLGL